MNDRLLVSALGWQESGKSFTWNELFGRTVKTGNKERKLYLNKEECVNVFLISGSPEERGQYVGDIITVKEPSIVLCSAQYTEEVKDTFYYFLENNYSVYVQWLNPGVDDKYTYFDQLGLINWLLYEGATLEIRDSSKHKVRVREIKDFIYGWAKSRGLIVLAK